MEIWNGWIGQKLEGWIKVETGMELGVWIYVGAFGLLNLGLSAMFLAFNLASAFAIGLPANSGVFADEVFPIGGAGIRGGRQLGDSGA